MDTSSEHPLDRAARIVGTAQELARLLGVSKGAVSQWKLPGRRTPPEYCPTIERLTAGAVRCEELCDAVEWSVLRSPVPCEGGQQLVLLP
ncbi:transcriptional regulator [Achromobacter insuavis]|uniref:transcriptional regulator n=1 Tax=Achromobacter insuavis TaxID=1287735 RepID=UPI001F146B75|nr:Cro/CI family transcriptional regulator [Achromobacter insuavis]